MIAFFTPQSSLIRMLLTARDDTDVERYRVLSVGWSINIPKIVGLTSGASPSWSAVAFVCPRCNITTSLKLSRTTKNPGKLFYSCPICKKFRWWQRSLRRMSNENDGVLNDGASSSASASTSSTSSFTVVGEVLTALGEMMKRLGMEEK
ncbi:hypothetical protein N665_1443s0002 [Sinapis alba]|nr:hypothetical protein N665_1443s0002 [Sinapis alba]